MGVRVTASLPNVAFAGLAAVTRLGGYACEEVGLNYSTTTIRTQILKIKRKYYVLAIGVLKVTADVASCLIPQCRTEYILLQVKIINSNRYINT